MKRTPLRRKGKSETAKLKEALWKLCRAIIIARHGRNCYTCPAQDLEKSNLQIGHFIPSSVCSTEMRYDLDNLRPQCFACNIWKSGNWPAYEQHLIKDGLDPDGLKARNRATVGMKADSLWYKATIATYTQEAQKMGAI